MEFKNTVVRLIRQYQTRQQLHNLPLFLIKDIGKTPQEIEKELNKNSFNHLITNKLSHLLTQSLKSISQLLSPLIRKN